ncbi:MAG: hypothetical protein JO353_07415 [Phycisphaerae bacterium]|nr:hypothetical protein [Phycisphaerae bacterium]
MLSGGRQRIIIRSENSGTATQLRSALSDHCDPEFIRDLFAAERAERDERTPHAVVVEFVNNGDEDAISKETLQFLQAVKERWPTCRRLAVSEIENLPAVIKAVHSGTIHGMLSKPLQPTEVAASVLSAANRPR